MTTQMEVDGIVVIVVVLSLGALVLMCPDNARTLAVVVIGIAGLAVASFSVLRSRRQRQATVSNRRAISVDEIYEQYFAGGGFEKESIVRLWRMCADKLRIPAELLRPDDRFGQELAPADVWASLDDPRDDLATFATAHAKEFGATVDLRKPLTVGELIRQLANIESGAGR